MRVAKWDNAKFVLIYCVVLGHLINTLDISSAFLKGLQVFIYTFHMPAFLFLAGLFSKRTVKGRRFDKMIPYLILYLFMKLFRFIVYSFMNGKASGFDLWSESGVPWYALTLFFCYVLTAILCALKERYVLMISIVMGVAAGYCTWLGDFLTGMRFFTFYPFFVMGYCMPVDRLYEFTQKRSVKMISAACMAVTLGICLMYGNPLYKKLGFLKGKNTYLKMKMYPYGGAYRAVFYLAALILTICVLALIPSVHCFITTWGSRSIQVFALHFPIIAVMKKTFHLQENLEQIWPAHYGLLLPVIAIVLTILLSLKIWQPFFDRLMHPDLSFLILHRKEKEHNSTNK